MIGTVLDVGRQEIAFWRKVLRCQHSLSRIGVHYVDCSVCCWPWQGAINEKGRGRTKYRFDDQDEVYASRVAWRFAHSRLPFPHGAEATHSCDMPSCCNPTHIEAKAHRINQSDMRDRGRADNGQHGGFRPRKLTWDKIFELRALGATKRYTGRELALKFGISAQMVSDILCGRSWGWPSNH